MFRFCLVVAAIVALAILEIADVRAELHGCLDAGGEECGE